MEAFLTMRHVDVARGDAIVLHDVSLEIGIGEHVAILGPNGCGKSTLIKTLTCECYPIVQPETRVRLFGRERWDISQLRRRLGVVSADLPGERTPVTLGSRCGGLGLLLGIDLVAESARDGGDAASAAEAMALMQARTSGGQVRWADVGRRAAAHHDRAGAGASPADAAA